MSNRRILVIDDEAPIRAVIQGCLEELAGWEVLTAESGYEGVAIASSQKPDAILLDMSMPGLDGEATFELLHNNPDTSFIPVVFLTAKALPEERAHYLKLGAGGLITKPFSPLTLASQIASQIGWNS